MADRGLDRLAVSLLEGIGRRLWGFPPRLMPFIVEQLGAARAVWWFATNMPRYERTVRALGPLRTHLACVAVSLHNGCPYCAYGHAYAADLVHLRDHGKVLPVDAATISGWVGLEPIELRERLHELLQEAHLHVEVLWIDRTLAMAAGEQGPTDRDEARIAHLVRMFRVLNTVGITGRVPPDEAHDPLNKEIPLKERHAVLRAVQG